MSSPARLALLLVAGCLLVHVALAGWIPLSPQEVYYWQYARHLDLSYFDHPPLAAWTIRLATCALGDGARAIRAAAALHAALFGGFFFLAARRLFDARIALFAIVALLVTPLFSLGTTVITPDAPLLAGWAAALYFSVRAVDEERGPWLLAAGAAVGWATLGKYTGWLLAPQILLLLLLDPRGRRLLRSPWPYLGLLLSVAIFSPVLIWNARHAWASFGFQLGTRAAEAGHASPVRVLRFLGLQSFALTPLLWVMALAAMVVAARRWREPAWRTCALFSLPCLLAFLAVSPFVWVKGNWPAPAYPTALLAAAALYGIRPRRGLAVLTLGVAVAGSAYLHAAALLPSLPFPAEQDTVTGWAELARRVQAERARLPSSAVIVGCGYKPASELAYLLPDRPETYGQNVFGEPGLQYGFWAEPGALVGRDVLAVRDEREPKSCLAMDEWCRGLEELPPLTVRRDDAVVTTFRLWRCSTLTPGPGTPR
jgi:4-amino-4-deoxy-L-arabinose transferase-like glycosyltransferase